MKEENGLETTLNIKIQPLVFENMECKLLTICNVNQDCKVEALETEKKLAN